MTYRADDGSEEWVWNSRDGVTPFVITLRSGKEAKHVEWHRDRRMPPDYRPPPGSRMFVDMTRERYRELMLAQARRYWSDESEFGRHARTQWASPEAMADALSTDEWREGLPDLVEVPVMPSTCQHGVTAPTFCTQCGIRVVGV
jgi:hypothetical protein